MRERERERRVSRVWDYLHLTRVSMGISTADQAKAIAHRSVFKVRRKRAKELSQPNKDSSHANAHALIYHTRSFHSLIENLSDFVHNLFDFLN